MKFFYLKLSNSTTIKNSHLLSSYYYLILRKNFKDFNIIFLNIILLKITKVILVMFSSFKNQI